MSIDFRQVVDGLGQGVAIVDAEGKVLYWNQWMERASARPAAEVLGRRITELYPSLASRAFERNFRSVLTLGIVTYYSQLLHGQLFPFKPTPGTSVGFDVMQQRCVIGPIREGGEVRAAYILVEDVTEAVAYQRRLAELALKDGLTKAFNRRYLDRRLADELARAARFYRGLSVILLDIDHFKQVNDAHGHQFGDQVLSFVSATIQASLRESDVLARYGGEEFCVILPETDLDAATLAAERLRAAVSSSPVLSLDRSASLTVSAGVAAMRKGDSAEALLARADQALYKAKEAGRNRVERAG